MENLTLDFNNFSSRVGLGTYEKCDSLTLTIVLDEKDYAGYKFKIIAKKSDGHIIEQDIKEQDINREEKTIKVELNNQFTTREGVVKLEINMIKDGKEDTTKEAFFMVRDTINGEVVESTSIIPTLEGVKVFIDEAVSSLGDLEQAGEDIALINGEFKENEIKRKANELLRERSEKERVRLESIRTNEEADRIKAEAERKEAENNRKVAESNRKLAENTRKTNEAARVEAELNRQSLFEENEEIRNENENLRIASEKERIKFNSEAKTDELNRKEAEKNRVLAEEERKSSEESRVAAEAIRQNTYTDFNESEEERKNNEIKRQEAEALRVEAETIRDNLFSEKEEERNASFIESEKVRNAAFNKTQDSRNTVFEESETVREEAFKISEKARNDAEELRVTAESERVKSEKLRVDSEKARVLAEEERNTTFTQKEEERNNTFTQNETNRNDTFTQSEEERKATFEEAENARKVAESKRVKAESSRVEAEKLRVTAETGRVEAENLRVTAEEERVAAETKRDEKIKELENKIDNGGNNSKNEEVIQARTATTGEVFNTLDERIDNEVDRLNKKIDVTMIQQEDKEIHTIDNSVEGLTTDIIVKGKIMYKKADGTYTDTWEEGCILESFGGEEGKISILSHGKNLWNKELFVPRLLDANSWDSSGAYRNNVQKIYLYEGTYKVSIPEIIVPPRLYPILMIKDDNNNQLAPLLTTGAYSNGDSDTNKIVSPREFTMRVQKEGYYNLNAYFLNGFSQSNLDKYKTILEADFQIEQGSVKTTYESYKEDKKDILLSDLGFDEGLRGINDISDELNSLRNVAIKRIGKREYREGDLLLDNVITDKVNTYYVLEEPIETPLDENINVKTFGERTYVSFENSISGTSSFKAPVNAAATISRLNRENRALEEENRSLRQDFESTTLSLTDSDLELVKQNVDMDFRLMEVEFALDIPQSTLSSNINFKKKGEVKSMARTPYEMMKIVILSGDYDREDYIHKVGKYYERGRMTKEEHDELMSLMTADEVISK
ncbi:hypothetical protein KLF35_05895 [Clostridium perfringens]|uniref:hypothetical protein n=1 Tax=Clostridium perfringens TaxID=1502 RepID=UPI001CCF43C0|nr:hypothetical protein [Clostridium perfringens]UBK76266.1 hypothetical protein KLF35_05895 [Clostridium perfringens]